MTEYLEDNRPTLDEVCESYEECTEECPAYEFCHPQAEWLDNKCSACGKGIEDLIDSREWYENERPNYCPFCGKKFKESEDI